MADQPGVNASDTDSGTTITVSSSVYDLNPTSDNEGRPRVYLGVRSLTGELIAERLKPVDEDITLPGEGGERVESTLSLQTDEYESYCGERLSLPQR